MDLGKGLGQHLRPKARAGPGAKVSELKMLALNKEEKLMKCLKNSNESYHLKSSCSIQ